MCSGRGRNFKVGGGGGGGIEGDIGALNVVVLRQHLLIVLRLYKSEFLRDLAVARRFRLGKENRNNIYFG